ncbi:MAG: flavodoxin-dependent (E)-4-hydroxy-3-methylbut-2-enyl-diphosphate synthase [Nanoarchaeota archaeon]
MRKSVAVKVGDVWVGGGHPVAIQSMTNTLTADVQATVAQIMQLADAGADIVRITINDEPAAKAVPEIVALLRKSGCKVPIVGDFHFNGHILLDKFPACAEALDKYRINPGNIGKGQRKDENFKAFIEAAIKHDKPVRIGINCGSLDEELVAATKEENLGADEKTVILKAMVRSALLSADFAEKLGLPADKIILSAKASDLQDMVTANTMLAEACEYPLHLGLTEAGGGIAGIVASSAALAILLEQGIGDTIRVSLTPRPGEPRTKEVEVCRQILQSLNLRRFTPKVISCPGCGRTDSTTFQRLAKDMTDFVERQGAVWKKRGLTGFENVSIAVMGCIVNGPGESKHADIGISFPGSGERPSLPVYEDGKLVKTLGGDYAEIRAGFQAMVDDYVRRRCS